MQNQERSINLSLERLWYYFKIWIREVFTIKKTQNRWKGTIKRILGICAPMLLFYFLIGPEAGVVAMVGSMTPVKVSNGLPLKPRALSLFAFSIATSVCIGLGAMTVMIPWSVVPMIFCVAFVATFSYHAIYSGPPGPIDLIFAAALGAYIVGHHGFDPFEACYITFFAALISSLIALADVLVRPFKPEQLAVQDATATVEEYLALKEDYDKAPQKAQHLEGKLAKLKNDATRRINRAWNYIEADKGLKFADKPQAQAQVQALKEELTKAHLAFARSLEQDQGSSLVNLDHIDLNSLGSPGIAYRIRHSLNSSSMPFFAALRIAIACAASALVVEACHLGHAYWAVLTAGMMLHMFPDRLNSVKDAAYKIVGESAGLIIYALMIPFILGPDMGFVVVVILLFLYDWLSPKNSMLALMAKTPQALLVSTLGHVGAEPTLSIVSTRAIETGIGICFALLAVYFVAKGSALRQLKAQHDNLMRALVNCLLQISAGELTSKRSQDARNELQYELMRYASAIPSAAKESSEQTTLKKLDHAASDLGYAVYWLSWSKDKSVKNAASQALSSLITSLDELSDKKEGASLERLTQQLRQVNSFVRI